MLLPCLPVRVNEEYMRETESITIKEFFLLRAYRDEQNVNEQPMIARKPY
jgi:hypothetical protein